MILKKYVVAVIAFVALLITIQGASTLMNKGTVEFYTGVILLLVAPAFIGWFSGKYIFKKGIKK